MGWTHYWKREVELPAEEFKEAVKDCEIILSKIDVPLTGPMSKGNPICNSKEIIFNGIKGQDCEPFSIKISEQPRRSDQLVFSYCKTEKLPYDICVKSVLIILKHYLGENIEIMTDGTIEDWSDAIDICMQGLGYGKDFSLSTQE